MLPASKYEKISSKISREPWMLCVGIPLLLTGMFQLIKYAVRHTVRNDVFALSEFLRIPNELWYIPPWYIFPFGSNEVAMVSRVLEPVLLKCGMSVKTITANPEMTMQRYQQYRGAHSVLLREYNKTTARLLLPATAVLLAGRKQWLFGGNCSKELFNTGIRRFSSTNKGKCFLAGVVAGTLLAQPMYNKMRAVTDAVATAVSF